VLGGPAGTRAELTDGAWIDLRRGWLSGSDELFTRLVDTVPWRAERRQMYDRMVDVPRLVRFYGAGAALPDRALDTARKALCQHYAPELGEPFTTAGLCFYRDGADGVAWHADRPLLLRPRGGGQTLRYPLGHGDLIVMGGSCQRTWEHAITKSARPTGPRISVQFRPRDVR